MKAEGRPRTEPFFCSEFCAGRAGKELSAARLIAARRNTDCIATGARSPGRLAGSAQPEQDLLQEKGARKDLVNS